MKNTFLAWKGCGYWKCIIKDLIQVTIWEGQLHRLFQKKKYRRHEVREEEKRGQRQGTSGIVQNNQKPKHGVDKRECAASCSTAIWLSRLQAWSLHCFKDSFLLALTSATRKLEFIQNRHFCGIPIPSGLVYCYVWTFSNWWWSLPSAEQFLNAQDNVQFPKLHRWSCYLYLRKFTDFSFFKVAVILNSLVNGKRKVFFFNFKKESIKGLFSLGKNAAFFLSFHKNSVS